MPSLGAWATESRHRYLSNWEDAQAAVIAYLSQFLTGAGNCGFRFLLRGRHIPSEKAGSEAVSLDFRKMTFGYLEQTFWLTPDALPIRNDREPGIGAMPVALHQMLISLAIQRSTLPSFNGSTLY